MPLGVRSRAYRHATAGARSRPGGTDRTRINVRLACSYRCSELPETFQRISGAPPEDVQTAFRPLSDAMRMSTGSDPLAHESWRSPHCNATRQVGAKQREAA